MTRPRSATLEPSVPSLDDELEGRPLGDELDPELAALPAPPRRERTLAVGVMLLTAVVAALMTVLLLGEARYALSPGQPTDLGELSAAELGREHANRYVRATALLGSTGAIRYGRAAEGDSFRLAPVAGQPNVWVEIRVPEGFEGPRFVPPTSFAGRLVPMSGAGLRHLGLTTSVQQAGKGAMPEGAWLLIDGASPRASRWALALAVLFGGFAVWNLVSVVRVLRKVRDEQAELRAIEEGPPPSV